MTDLNQLWQSALSELELQISRANFLTWLKNSHLVQKDDEGKILVSLPNNFAKEWVQNKYHKMILGAIRSLDDSVKRVEYVVVSDRRPGFKEDSPVGAAPKQQASLPELEIDPETNLHPRYTLNSFVVGSSNELSYAASMAVVKDVGKKYNPLFVYGCTGLGKTHLIQAVGNEIRAQYKNKIKVKYV